MNGQNYWLPAALHGLAGLGRGYAAGRERKRERELEEEERKRRRRQQQEERMWRWAQFWQQMTGGKAPERGPTGLAADIETISAIPGVTQEDIRTFALQGRRAPTQPKPTEPSFYDVLQERIMGFQKAGLEPETALRAGVSSMSGVELPVEPREPAEQQPRVSEMPRARYENYREDAERQITDWKADPLSYSMQIMTNTAEAGDVEAFKIAHRNFRAASVPKGKERRSLIELMRDEKNFRGVEIWAEKGLTYESTIEDYLAMVLRMEGSAEARKIAVQDFGWSEEGWAAFESDPAVVNYVNQGRIGE